MKAVIFAGGYGTRLGKLTDDIPKPMITVGEKPILWHIMKIYSHYGIKEFVVCLGYKGSIIKDYFINYQELCNDFTLDFRQNKRIYHTDRDCLDWKVTLAETGINAQKGARLKKIEPYLEDDINLLTYGDGVANIDISELISFHRSSGKLVTITGVHPPARFGELEMNGENLLSFAEKPQTSKGYINGGYMVFHRKVLEYLTTEDDCDFEYGILEELVGKNQVAVYRHDGLWACMDTERDMRVLNEMWFRGKAFWKVWD